MNNKRGLTASRALSILFSDRRMPFNLFTVAGSITPIVINTFFHHYLRKPIQHPAQEQLSYDEGIHLIRQFLSRE